MTGFTFPQVLGFNPGTHPIIWQVTGSSWALSPTTDAAHRGEAEELSGIGLP